LNGIKIFSKSRNSIKNVIDYIKDYQFD